VCRIHLINREALDAVCAFFRNAHVVVSVEPDWIVLSIPGAPTDVHEQREIAGYVATWNALNPSSPVELEDRA
jgi:hypothetical protein